MGIATSGRSARARPRLSPASCPMTMAPRISHRARLRAWSSYLRWSIPPSLMPTTSSTMSMSSSGISGTVPRRLTCARSSKRAAARSTGRRSQRGVPGPRMTRSMTRNRAAGPGRWRPSTNCKPGSRCLPAAGTFCVRPSRWWLIIRRSLPAPARARPRARRSRPANLLRRAHQNRHL